MGHVTSAPYEAHRDNTSNGDTGWKAGCTRRHDDCQLAREVPLAWFRDAFPRGIQPSDLDGIVEVNGRILMLEFKSVDAGYNLPEGQRRLFNAFLLQSPLNRVWTVWHWPGTREFQAMSIGYQAVDVFGKLEARWTRPYRLNPTEELSSLRLLKQRLQRWAYQAEQCTELDPIPLADQEDANGTRPVRQHARQQRS